MSNEFGYFTDVREPVSGKRKHTYVSMRDKIVLFATHKGWQLGKDRSDPDFPPYVDTELDKDNESLWVHTWGGTFVTAHHYRDGKHQAEIKDLSDLYELLTGQEDWSIPA